MNGHTVAQHSQSQMFRETKTSSKMNVLEASGTKRGGGAHGSMIASARQPVPVRINAQHASEGELEISLYLRRNTLSDSTQAQEKNRGRKAEVIGRACLVLTASHPVCHTSQETQAS